MNSGRMLLATSVFCAALAGPGCGKNEDGAGTKERSLPPPSPTWVDPALADGKADWHPFREPKLGEPAPTEPAEGQAEGRTKDIEAAIREMITAHNELSAKQDEEGVLEYYVETQREAVKGVFATGKAVLGKLDELKTVLAEKLPDAKERIDNMFAPVLARGNAVLDAEFITVIDDAHAEGGNSKLPVKPAYRFVKINDDWFIEISDALLATIGPTSQGALGMMEQLLQGLRSGATPAAAVMESLEPVLTQMAGPSSAGEPKPAPEPSGGSEPTPSEKPGD